MSQDTAWISKIKQLEIKDQKWDEGSADKIDEDDFRGIQYDQNQGNFQKTALFLFDPNTLSEDGWKKLGLRDKTIKTIQNYISKGGRFKKPEDLQKIYGLRKSDYEKLTPYIRIESTNFVQTIRDETKPATINETQQSKEYKPRYTVIDINTADTSDYISLPGIGSRLAARIVNFREKLGGFYSIEQVGETYAVPDSTFQKIKQYLKLENPDIRKININTATIDELKAHPYIKYSLANPIVAYRNEHGPFLKLEDLKKVMAVTEEVYKKISPYLFSQ